ncbi:MAG: hypothetical protein IPL27_26185, partial [Lewinellaceae bacterium]|nr:hypothetical protein [Lewinellaceae bacterium]
RKCEACSGSDRAFYEKDKNEKVVIGHDRRFGGKYSSRLPPAYFGHYGINAMLQKVLGVRP